MIRNSYEIMKAKVSASCSYYTSYYELNVWFKDTDLDSRGIVYNVSMYEMKEKAGVKRGDGFKKIQAFLDTEEGRKWLESELYRQDLKVATDKVEDSIRVTIAAMSLSELTEFDRLGKKIIEKNVLNKKL